MQLLSFAPDGACERSIERRFRPPSRERGRAAWPRVDAMRWEQVSALGRALPEVSEDLWYRTPALKVRGKGFARLKEDGRSLMLLLEGFEERSILLERQPGIYFITDHYRGWSVILARLPALRVAECRLRLERAWRMAAPRALVQRMDERR